MVMTLHISEFCQHVPYMKIHQCSSLPNRKTLAALILLTKSRFGCMRLHKSQPAAGSRFSKMAQTCAIPLGNVHGGHSDSDSEKGQPIDARYKLSAEQASALRA
jgi:hypothetical protein